MTPNHARLPVPRPPEPPGAPEPWLKRLLRQRFFLVALVILVFLALLFGWHSLQPSGPAQLESHPTVAEAPQGPASGAAKPQPHPAGPAPPSVAPGPKEGEHAKAPAPAKEAPAHAPAHPAASAPAREPVKGEIFTKALIKIMDEQVNGRLFGWRPSTILFGKMGLTDNVNNIQLGVLEVARRTVVVLNENMTRFATTEAYNPRVNEAMNYFMVSPDKYWFPSASGKYQEAMQDLEIYIEGLRQGRSRFYTRVDNLIVLLTNYKDILGSCFNNLLKDKEADGTPVSWWVVDDYFYFSRGVALGMSQMLEAVEKDFHAELQKKNSQHLLEEAIHALHSAANLAPWIVFNGSKNGFIANHRANLATYIGEAEHVISTLTIQLATN